MLVVVYLMDAKKNIIIPQDWILALDQETLNNVGKASYQHRRIFWSNHGLSDDGIPDESIAPNFYLPLSKTFPPPENLAETCYIARVKQYCATVPRAKMFRDQFRARQPIRYSNRRKSDGLTPSTSPTPNEQSDSDLINSPHALNSNSSQPREAESLNFNGSNPVAQSNSHEFQNERATESSNDEPQIQVDDTSADSGETINQASSEVKSIMPNVEMGEEESFAIDSVFDDDYSDDNLSTNSSDSENMDQELPNVNLSRGETVFWDGGILKVKKKYGRDCEITYTYGERLAPKVPVFETKMNDLISMNIPFKENGNGDRAYLVTTKQGSKEVQLASRIVNGLKQLNSGDKRESRQFDKAYITALIVGIIGIQQVKDHGVDKDVLKFIKSLFDIRVAKHDDENGSRYLSFKRLADLASDEIKENNFKK
ncbi:uncharacterized protein LOC129567536 [Sitodiplosis mosellana]|uniref:uncharacterized protein LOC129567536 n=1 Tax=Sitodiplosis mosellana TaxID=263140 RepID=UPI002444FF5D|nr:uncharacterized protein LOC129567536 [Sitodiplosis mosellana]